MKNPLVNYEGSRSPLQSKGSLADRTTQRLYIIAAEEQSPAAALTFATFAVASDKRLHCSLLKTTCKAKMQIQCQLSGNPNFATSDFPYRA